jgi:hypothetical protein
VRSLGVGVEYPQCNCWRRVLPQCNCGRGVAAVARDVVRGVGGNGEHSSQRALLVPSLR